MIKSEVARLVIQGFPTERLVPKPSYCPVEKFSNKAKFLLKKKAVSTTNQTSESMQMFDH